MGVSDEHYHFRITQMCVQVRWILHNIYYNMIYNKCLNLCAHTNIYIIQQILWHWLIITWICLSVSTRFITWGGRLSSSFLNESWNKTLIIYYSPTNIQNRYLCHKKKSLHLVSFAVDKQSYTWPKQYNKISKYDFYNI